MIDLILLIVALISIVISVLGFRYLNKSNQQISNSDDLIQLLREERLNFNKKSSRKRKALKKELEKISTINSIEIYQTAKKNGLSVGEILLASKINSLK